MNWIQINSCLASDQSWYRNLIGETIMFRGTDSDDDYIVYFDDLSNTIKAKIGLPDINEYYRGEDKILYVYACDVVIPATYRLKEIVMILQSELDINHELDNSLY